MTGEQDSVFIVVYYRDVPSILKSSVSRDGRMKITKDGIHSSCGHSCPRLTITMEALGQESDKVRLKSLMSLLSELEGNNQIVSYSVKR